MGIFAVSGYTYPSLDMSTCVPSSFVGVAAAVQEWTGGHMVTMSSHDGVIIELVNVT